MSVQFPWQLDMEPYTASGMERLESDKQHISSTTDKQNMSSTTDKQNLSRTTDNHFEGVADYSDRSVGVGHTSLIPSKLNYELVGVVVHSGQANAGHYYSLIKDRR